MFNKLNNKKNNKILKIREKKYITTKLTESKTCKTIYRKYFQIGNQTSNEINLQVIIELELISCNQNK